MGFKTVVVPESCSEGSDKLKAALIPCKTLLDALNCALGLSSYDVVLGKRDSKNRSRRKQKSREKVPSDDLRSVDDTQSKFI